MSENQILGAQAVADKLGVSRPTVVVWMQSGRLLRPDYPYRNARNMRLLGWREADIDAWAAEPDNQRVLDRARRIAAGMRAARAASGQ